jgi:enoyl-CoA hydratase/carnithine racemase
VIPNTAMARLPAIVGRRRALDIMATRRRVPASEALALGLVNQLAPADEVVGAAVDLAGRIVNEAPPGALSELKQGLDRHQRTDWPEVRASVGRLPEAQWREGLAAFLEKRPPQYKDFWNDAG